MFLKAITCFLILFLIENNIIYISATEYVISDTTANFFEAFAYCQQANMRLVTVTSCKDEARLNSYLGDIDEGPSNGYWLGATNLHNISSKIYYWLTTGARTIYTNWLPKEPNNYQGEEHCLSWAKWDDLKGWNDFNCEHNIKYICEENWD